MSAAVVALVLGSALFLRPELDPPADAPVRYTQQCASASTAGTAPCTTLRTQTEVLAIQALLAMRVTQRPVPKELLRESLRNEMPALQATALSLFEREPVDAQDGAAIVAAMDSPYPAVRKAAVKVLPRAPGSDPAQAASKRNYERVFGGSAPAAFEFTADPVPDATQLGAAPYPGSRFVYFASGPRRAFFTTRDPVAKVVAYYAKAGAKPRTLAELNAPRPNTKPDPSEIMRRMQAGEDPSKIIAEFQGNAMSKASSSEWTKGIAGEPGVEDAQFVEVAPGGMVNGQVRQPRAVAVYRDTLLGKTAIVFPRPANAATAPLTSGDDIQQQVLEQQVLAQPVPQFQAVDPTAR